MATYQAKTKLVTSFILTTDNLNRFRVSRKLTIPKIITYIILIGLGYNLIVKLYSNTLTLQTLAGFIGSLIIFSILLYYINSMKTIEYDDIKQSIYVFTSKDTLEYELPVENIDEILLTSIGFDHLGYSYSVVFRDANNQKRKFLFFTIPFRKDIQTIIADTRLKNPKLKTNI